MAVQPGDVLKLTAEFLLGDGTIAQNVYYLRAVLVAQIADALAISTLKTWLEAGQSFVMGAMSSAGQCNPATVDVIAWDGAKWSVTQHVGIFTPNNTPTNNLEQLPNQVAPFASFNTNRPKSNGRKFLPGYCEDQSAGSYLTAAALAALVSYAAAVLANATIGPLDYFVPGVPRTAVNLFLDFAVAVVTNVVGTQRRRRPGVGI